MDRETGILVESVPGIASDDHYSLTSPCDEYYNCIAWALEISDKWIWPLEPEASIDDDITEDVLYWPDTLPLSDEIDNFVALFEQFGYERCNDAALEDGYKKIVLYAKAGRCTHAARQLPSGLWTSKMGPLNDIQHGSPEVLEGDFFGQVSCYMSKRTFHT